MNEKPNADNCKTANQDGIDALNLLKPVLMEVLDDIKYTKTNNDENINSKMQSIQRDLNEKIELIKPTLLEVLNELKENKKNIRRELPSPQSATVEIIKPMLTDVLEEIKDSNRKTQKVLTEIKNDKKESLRELKHSLEDKLSYKFPKSIASLGRNEINDQTEYESTNKEDVNTIESNETYINQKKPLETHQDAQNTQMEILYKEAVEEKNFETTKKIAADHNSKRYYNKRKLQPKHGIKYDKRNFRRSSTFDGIIIPSNIFNASEILSSSTKIKMVKDVIKTMAKERLVSLVSELLADRFIDKLKETKNRNENREENHSETNLIKIEETRHVFRTVTVTTTEKPVTVQRFEIYLG